MCLLEPKRGSRHRLKAVAHPARQRRKLANRRKIHLHQLTAAIAARFGGIAVEELKVKTMTASAKGTVERLAMRPHGPKRPVGPYPKRCAHCQIKVRRDVNAARNVLKRAAAARWSGFARQNNSLAAGLTPQTSGRSSPRNSGKDFELRHYWPS
jgi:transposase